MANHSNYFTVEFNNTKSRLVPALGWLCLSFFLFLCFSSSAQRVYPFQSGSYVGGLVSTRDMAPVPPGFYFINYNFWHSSKGYIDRNGNRFNGGNVSLPGQNEPVFINFDPSVKAFASVIALSYSTRLEFLNATYQVAISPTYVDVNYRVFLTVGNQSETLSGSANGITDLSFMPVDLSWSIDKKWDFGLMYTLYAPTAAEDLSQNYWTHQLQAPVYFYLGDQATAFMFMPTLELNGRYKNVDFRAGNRMTIEYGIGQYFTEWLEIEVINAHNWQMGSDSGSEFWWRRSVFDSRDRTNTFSAGIGVWPNLDWLNLRFRYIRDYGARLRFENQLYSFSFIITNGIFKKKDQG